MSTPIDASQPVVFKPRAGRWFAGTAWVLVGVGVVFAVATDGIEGLQTAWPLFTLAFFAWWLFWFPSVEVDEDAVTLKNPIRRVRVPWEALIHVDTRFSMTLVTPYGRYGSWAAPAPGIWGTHRGKPEHVQGLPETTYGPARSIRPGDLKNTDSGAAAFMVRTRWSERTEAGGFASDAVDAKIHTHVNWLLILCGATLLTASGIAFSLT